MFDNIIPAVVLGVCVVLALLYWRGQRGESQTSTYRGRRHAAGALGDEGENVVSARLRKLPEEYDVFNDVVFQHEGRSTQIDHVVVSRYGLYVIETKNMAGPIYGSENSEFWSEYLPETRRSKREYRFRNPIWQNEGHIKALRAVLQDTEVPVYGIVVFPAGTELNVNTKKKVTTWDQLYHTITRYDEPVMDAVTVAKYSALIGEANVIDPEVRETHVQIVRENRSRRNQMVAEGNCPKCGGKLVERDGPYGRFLGCSNYPKCKYVLK